MEQPGAGAGNFALSFSPNFLSIFVHISGSIWPITLIWVSSQRSFPPQKLSIDDANFGQSVKSDDVRSRKKAKVCHGRLRAAQESMG